LLAILLLVPYGRTGTFVRVTGSVLILLLGACFLSIFFGVFLFSDRLVSRVIPTGAWISLAQWIVFLLLQVTAILMMARRSTACPARGRISP
jgi:hypothetical protein